MKTKARALCEDAAKLDRQATALRHKAERLAKRGCCFTAAQYSEDALRHEAEAAKLRISAYNHEEN